MSAQRIAAVVLAVLACAPRILAAQNPPARLPAVVVRASPDYPGPRQLVGVVRDTFATPLEGVEITMPGLLRRIATRSDGSFRIEDVPPGKHTMRARKIGFHPQIKEIVV